MRRKGILVYGLVAATLMLSTVSLAEETAEEVTTMMNWWEDVGKTWEESRELLDLTAQEPPLPPSEPMVSMVENVPDTVPEDRHEVR